MIKAKPTDWMPWQIEEIKKALGEADAGDFASDEEVESMFDELIRGERHKYPSTSCRSIAAESR
jgi:predicted transcriptional regulator